MSVPAGDPVAAAPAREPVGPAREPVEPTREQVEAARRDPKLANIVYHDWESGTYDAKWAISYDARCVGYARDRFVRLAGTDGWPYPLVLEIGAGTGFFLLNLALAGVVGEGHVTDISPGMVRAALRNAEALNLPVRGRVADAERIPYEDGSFDLVVGHAVLHHIPDVELALREVLRVLRPGGRFVICGEPSTWGQAVSRRLTSATWWAATRAVRLPALRGWGRPARELAASSRAAALEWVVDLHTFHPRELAGVARRAGAAQVATATDELTAAWFGWPVRTVEAALDPDRLGPRWRMFAYRTWLALDAFDRQVSARVAPERLFYNISVTGVRPRD